MKSQIINTILKHKELSAFILVLGLTVVFSKLTSKTPAAVVPADNAQQASDVSTFIPHGHSLVPLEIANYETLDSIFGPFGVVDLYVQDPTAKNFSRFVAKHVKLIRAPKNPSHFAALVPSVEISKLMRFSGPFFAVVQNPKTTGTHFEKEKKALHSRIRYNLGE